MGYRLVYKDVMYKAVVSKDMMFTDLIYRMIYCIISFFLRFSKLAKYL